MTVITNTVVASDLAVALDREMIKNYNQEYDRLAEILGIFSPEVMQAGQALYQYTISGSLNPATVAEGDEVPLSHYTATRTLVGSLEPKPYRKLTTAQAIMKSGFEIAIMRTDAKMLQNARNAIINDFFTFLATGTGTATATNLQGILARVDATLQDSLETNGDQGGTIAHFVNRQDAATYLATATITDQTLFGMTYLQNFLGVSNVFLTNKVTSGTVYATPTDNIHIYGIDFGALAQADLQYATDSNGLIGVHHEPNYSRTSAETYLLSGALMFPEVTNYICKGTIAAQTPAAEG